MDQFLIEPNGDVVTDPVAVRAALSALQDAAAGVVTLSSPLTIRGLAPYVGWIDDWGATKELPLNRKAWALYGRSPIYGPMVVRNDLGLEIPDELVATVTKPLDEWVGPETLARMQAILDASA